MTMVFVWYVVISCLHVDQTHLKEMGRMKSCLILMHTTASYCHEFKVQ